MSESSEELKRIAIALEEILRLVKKDMEDSKARITKEWDKEIDLTHYKEKSNQADLPFPEVEEK